MVRANCWELMKCGREPGGERARELGICPATTEARLDGTHHGMNGGRACWVVAGTLCRGEVQGTFARKYGECAKCRFYLRVREEELPDFTMAASLRRFAL